MDNKTEKSKINEIAAIITVVIFILLFVKCVFSDDEPKKLTHKEQIESLFAGEPPNGFHIGTVNFVSSKLKDPKSFDHLSTSYFELNNELFITMEFTAKNSFGGNVRSEVMVKGDTLGNVIEVIKWFE